MAKLRFEIEGQPNEVAYSTFLTAANNLIRILCEIDVAISSRGGGSLRWYVSALHSNGGLTIDMLSRVRPAPKRQKEPFPDIGLQVTRSLVAGFDALEQGKGSPPYLSEYGLSRIQKMFDVLEQNGARGYRAVDLEQQYGAEVSRKAGENVRQLLPVRRQSIGAVEGRMEAISIHREPKFIVYEALTRKGITCRFTGGEMMLETVKGILGRRVNVSGRISWNVKDEPVRVDIENIGDIRLLGHGPLPTTRDMVGYDPNITEGLDSTEYIRSIRRE